jgi:hypothetical protein
MNEKRLKDQGEREEVNSTKTHKRTLHGTHRRVHFTFPEPALHHLDELKERIGAPSRVEVLKIALGLLHWTVDHLAEGHQITAMHSGKVEETIILPGIHLHK